MERASRRQHGPICGPGSDTGADLVISHWALELCCERFSVGTFYFTVEEVKKDRKEEGETRKEESKKNMVVLGSVPDKRVQCL